MSDLPTIGKKSVTQLAREEVQAEKIKKAVEKMKIKLRELDAAETVYKNLQREVEDLELAINQGNV